VAALGAAYVKTALQTSVIPTTPFATLQQQQEAQVDQIAALQAQITDARRYVAIGEARLNKWRSRVFNSSGV
jgi:phycoerythrin-associated linker protein